jgi:hypothetical protein
LPLSFALLSEKKGHQGVSSQHNGARYIGSHMVHALVDAGQQVVVLDNPTTVPPRAPLAIGDAKDKSPRGSADRDTSGRCYPLFRGLHRRA